MSSPAMGCAVVYLVTSGLLFKARNVNPEGLVRAHWAVNPSLALQGVSASVSQAGTRLRTHSAALLIPQAPCASPLRDTSQGFLFFEHCQPRGWLTDENTGRFADVKAISLEQIICPGAQRGHGSTLWCHSLTIWRYLCFFPVGIWCQLYQDDARGGHLEVSLVVLISGWMSAGAATPSRMSSVRDVGLSKWSKKVSTSRQQFADAVLMINATPKLCKFFVTLTPLTFWFLSAFNFKSKTSASLSH